LIERNEVVASGEPDFPFAYLNETWKDSAWFKEQKYFD
jgi:hypothetical protein